VKMSRNTAESRIVEGIRKSPVGRTLAVRLGRSSAWSRERPDRRDVAAMLARWYADLSHIKQIRSGRISHANVH
jgi:hypothetical protein